MKYGYEQINYTNFENDLYDARFELAASRIMDTDLETIEDTIIEECEKVAVNGSNPAERELLGILLSSIALESNIFVTFYFSTK